ncbi:MAG: hypothetical protein ACD_45C00221G0001 [uncultured bacterium]|nr:MAG: hypothetical protein ACD_45C00221G0001 [uncultured bacterium]
MDNTKIMQNLKINKMCLKKQEIFCQQALRILPPSSRALYVGSTVLLWQYQAIKKIKLFKLSLIFLLEIYDILSALNSIQTDSMRYI